MPDIHAASFFMVWALWGPLVLFDLERTEPELILYNGKFWTVNPRQPRAQAVAISGGRFLAIGSNDEVLALAAGTRQENRPRRQDRACPDSSTRTLIPPKLGWIHLRMVDCDLRSIADILAALRKRAAQTPSGQWVLGFKYDDTKTSEGRPLSLQDLDAAVPDHPGLRRASWRPHGVGEFPGVQDGKGGRADSRPAGRQI